MELTSIRVGNESYIARFLGIANGVHAIFYCLKVTDEEGFFQRYRAARPAEVIELDEIPIIFVR